VGVKADQRIEDGQHVATVFDDALEDIAEAGLVLGFAVPFGQHGGRDFDIAAELVG